MSAFKGTPGPWRHVRTNGSPTHGEHLIAGASPGYLAEVRCCGSGSAQANARLIAAAPELLEALRGMMAEYEALHAKHDLGDCQATVDARAAIAKATGGAA